MTTNPPELATISEPLRFTAEGEWFHGAERVEHPKVLEFFSKRLRYYPELKLYGVESLGRVVQVTVDATPRVVRTFDHEQAVLTATLSDDTVESVSFLFEDQTGELYLKSSASSHLDTPLTRVTRTALQSLQPLIEESDTGYVVRLSSNQTVLITRLP